jgi:hypothetical protein
MSKAASPSSPSSLISKVKKAPHPNRLEVLIGKRKLYFETVVKQPDNVVYLVSTWAESGHIGIL